VNIKQPSDAGFEMIELDGFLADRYLITIHDEPIPSIEHAKRHFENHVSRLTQGTSYLAYEILDAMIDLYVPLLDYFEEQLEQLEQSIGKKPFTDNSAQDYLNLSREILTLRRLSVKNQNVFYQLSHSNLSFIDVREARLFRDVYDHVVRVVDMSEYYQQALRSILEIHLSLASNKVNQVAQFLTIIATIMLPLSVITGIYGMNFQWMPMLHSPYGFGFVMTLMALVAFGMLVSFRKRSWI
jgi:magnesium transporter